jgi:hypothetical protein
MATRITSVEDALRLLRSYERGCYTRHETVASLIQAAASCEPSDLAEVLPAEWLQTIEKETSLLPESLSEAVFISGILGGPGFDYEAYCAEMRRNWFDGARAWHRYFA